jgi:late competence protein required for DNA uptake (superfamily II DNA/RNA helicase)
MLNRQRAVATNNGFKQNYYENETRKALSNENYRHFQPNNQQKRCRKCKNEDLKFAEFVSGFLTCIWCLQFEHHSGRRNGLEVENANC